MNASLYDIKKTFLPPALSAFIYKAGRGIRKGGYDIYTFPTKPHLSKQANISLRSQRLKKKVIYV